MIACLVKAADAREDAEWRTSRLSTEDYVLRCFEEGFAVTPLLSVPGVSIQTFRRDWLHAVDQGVAADFLGSFFKKILAKFEAPNRKARCRLLWLKIQEWYATNDVQDRLVGLKCAGIQGTKGSPKLKGSAAAVRALVPFAAEYAAIHLDRTDLVENSIIVAAENLKLCYDCLHSSAPHWEVVLKNASKHFAIQYQSLQDHCGPKNWKVKPKMHVFLEICSDGTRPNLCWTYRDEDYGGSVSKLCRQRGKWTSVSIYSKKMLSHWRIQNPMPRIR